MCMYVTGVSDSNASATIANARSVGLKNVDVYLFPCPKCDKSASDQVSEMGKTEGTLEAWGLIVMVVKVFLEYID